MSRGFDWGSDYPHKFKNETGAALPGFSIVRCRTSGAANGIYLRAGVPDADGEEAYFVTAKELANNAYGHCRATLDVPFWVRCDSAETLFIAHGDTVGPVKNETYVSRAGSGMVVMYKRADDNLLLCATIVSTETFALFQLIDDLVECGESATGLRFSNNSSVLGGCDSLFASAGARGSGQETEICPGWGWRGVAFGGALIYDTPPPPDGPIACDLGDVVLARKIGPNWYAVGSGHVNLRAEALNDVAVDDEGAFTAEFRNGICNDCGYRSKAVAARALTTFSQGNEALLHWNGKEWLAINPKTSPGCGLMIDPETGAIRIDSSIAGEGLAWDEESCTLNISEDEEEGCNLAELCARVDDLEDRMDDAETRLDDIEDEIQNILDDIRDLFECCRQNQECCYYLDERLDYCCDAGLPNASECGRCVWDWNAADESPVLVQGCSGGGTCACVPPDPLEFTVAGIYYTECHGDPAAEANGCDCCVPDCIPNNLVATFSGSSCAELDGETVPIVGSGNTWTGSTTICGDTYEVTMECTAGGELTATLEVNGFVQGTVTAETVDCATPSFFFPSFSHSPSCAGCEMSTEVSITVTE